MSRENLNKITVPDDAYAADWNGSLEVPTKNALFDKIEALSLSVSPWTVVKKTADETKTANTTLADDNQLQFTPQANTKYAIRGKIFYATTAAGDFKYSLKFNGTAGLFRFARNHIVPGTTAFVVALAVAADNGATVTMAGTGTEGYISFEGILWVNATALFSFQWAQNTSDAGNTIVRTGSYFEYLPV